MAKVVLHQWEMSPFCNKTRRCLNRKGVTFETINYNGLEARNAAKLSKVGTLPVLDWDGERIQDSAAIALFLDRQIPEPALYPSDPEARARARFWEDWAGQSLYFFEIYFRMLNPEAMERALDLIGAGRPRFERAILKLVFRRRYPQKLKWQGLGKLTPAEAEQKLVGHLEDLELLLSRKSWLVGDAPTIADLSVAAQLDEMVRISGVSARVLGYTKIREWLARLPPA